MHGIRLIRNGWVIGIVLALYSAALWGGFVRTYEAVIDLQRLARSPDHPEPERVVRLYETIARSRLKRTNLETFVTLGEVLERAGQWNQAVTIWQWAAAAVPEDDGLRWRLALALHNAGRYTEAETYFAALLREDAR